MGLAVIHSVLTVRMSCDFRDCGHTQEFEAPKIEQIETAAKQAGWKLRGVGPGFSKRTDWCKSHWRPCPTCGGTPVTHIDKDDGKPCGCQGSYHDVELELCGTCKGTLVQYDKEPVPCSR